jgi:hypothetical protein
MALNELSRWTSTWLPSVLVRGHLVAVTAGVGGDVAGRALPTNRDRGLLRLAGGVASDGFSIAACSGVPRAGNVGRVELFGAAAPVADGAVVLVDPLDTHHRPEPLGPGDQDGSRDGRRGIGGIA